MLESIDLIEKYITLFSLDNFKENRKTIDAVVRNFEVIGEASKFIPDEIKGKHAEVDWPRYLDLETGSSTNILGSVCQLFGRLLKTNYRG